MKARRPPVGRGPRGSRSTATTACAQVSAQGLMRRKGRSRWTARPPAPAGHQPGTTYSPDLRDLPARRPRSPIEQHPPPPPPLSSRRARPAAAGSGLRDGAPRDRRTGPGMGSGSAAKAVASTERPARARAASNVGEGDAGSSRGGEEAHQLDRRRVERRAADRDLRGRWKLCTRAARRPAPAGDRDACRRTARAG